MLFKSKDARPSEIDIKPDGKIATNKAIEKKIKAKESMKKAFRNIDKGKDIHFVSAGTWSTHDLMEYLLEKTGPAEVTCCTWSVSNPALEKLMKLMNGKITKLNMLMDWSKGKDAATWIRMNAHKFNTSTCHAKVTVIENDKHNIAIVGSANWTNNPRIEAGVLSTDKDICKFHKDWIMNEINRDNTLGLDL